MSERQRWVLWTAALITALSGLASVGIDPALAANPSFDCGQAQTPDERAICADDRLAELDQALSIAYRQVPSQSREAARSQARQAVADRRSCGADKICILDQQAGALETFSDLGSQVPVPPWIGQYRLALFAARAEPPTSGLPRQVGRCTMTKIASITTRFGEVLKPPSSPEDSSGTAVSFADRGSQVSYSYVPALAESQIGDQVLLCLSSIPKNCPPGDTRGRVYSGTNLRTKGSWLMPDSQHSCGGA